MSVFLFSSKNDVFSQMSCSYEGLKSLTTKYSYRRFTSDDDYHFYQALRRLHFANVACYLCQYHDDTPVPASELTSIETFSEFEPVQPPANPDYKELFKQFSQAWRSLKYNLITNDAEIYKPINSFEYIDALERSYTKALMLFMLEEGSTPLSELEDQSEAD